MEEYRVKKKKGWFLKLDIEKSFDCVDWDFLDKVLKCKVFNDKWIKWIQACVRDSKFSVFINSCPRGIVQGDP